MQVSDGLYDIYVGDLVRASNDYEGSQLVKVTEIHDEIGDHCGLEGPGFVGLVLDELTLTPRYELCYTPDMVQSKER
jgi:hypothetical protein|tara:strand:+ start:956 stop:1186 length:231 start_codon:yes stop_codon:yes gene_type:complete